MDSFDLDDDDDGFEAEWLEQEAIGGLRIWQLTFLCLGSVLSVVVMLCCCFRFRIPRTKQDIEADYQRRIIAKKFRERLKYIKNSEMDEMDLQKALERVRHDVLAGKEAEENLKFLENSNTRHISNGRNRI